MKLSSEQQKLLRDERGIIANKSCDACGKVLGSVRWTRRNETGEWCSRECRDGKAHAADAEARIEARRAGRAGRPRKYADQDERQIANAQYQRDFRKRQVATVSP